MPFGLLADLVLVLHALFIAFAALGALAALRWRWAPLVHLPAAAWGVFVELCNRACPLTPLENALREAAGRAGYADGFVSHWLAPLVYPAGLTLEASRLLGAGLLLLNAALYALVARRRWLARGPSDSRSRRSR